MSLTQEYVQTDRERRFLERVVDTQYKREIINGLAPFLDERAPADMATFYSSDELVQLRVLKGTARDVEKRMPVKVTRHYYDLATKSKPMQRLVKASPDETMDLAGSEDPGHQMDYSPVEGLLNPENKAKLAGILTYHVLPGKVMAADVKTMKAKTVNGQELAIKVSGGTVTADEAKVIKTDVAASNGVIHAIDAVIMPK
jgi:hypothetical protein